MSTTNLHRMFAPERIAVIGASDTPGKVGYTVFEHLTGGGFAGVVYPVNPGRDTVQARKSYPSIGALPEQVDLGVICTPADTVSELVREAGEVGLGGVVVISAGFGEGGERGRERRASLEQTAAQFPDLRIMGPNCLGFISPHAGLNASFAGETPEAGNVAFVSQSGALCTAVLDWARHEGIGFSHFVSIGNMFDVDFGDLIDYFAGDGRTESVILYIESITDAREFMSAARAFSRTHPIIAFKAGRFARSAEAAASHTGAMAGEDVVFDAAFRRAGIERVTEIGEIFDVAELLARSRRGAGDRLGIVTNAGGPGVIAVDALLDRGGTLATLTDDTVEALSSSLPAGWSRGNPVDVLGDATPDRYEAAIDAVARDPHVDAVLVILTPQAMTDPTTTAGTVAELAAEIEAPLLAVWMGAEQVRRGVEYLNEAGVPTYSTPEDAVHAFLHLDAYARNLEFLYETPEDVPGTLSFEAQRVDRTFEQFSPERSPMVSEPDTKGLLDACGIAVAAARKAASADEAVAAADELGYPVALKVLSPQITHKSDVDGVRLDLADAEEVRAAFSDIVDAAAENAPDARVDGVSVQPMVRADGGVELLLGARKDPTFGAVIMVAAGGTAAELYGDQALELPPLNERLARRMLASLRIWPLLRGYREDSGVNLDRLVETLIRFSYLITEHPEIDELDINPLLATPDDCIALDARARLDRDAADRSVPRHAHLAIRPYPSQFVRREALDDGTRVLLRPIRPEDEPLWQAFLASCSPRSLHDRFGYLFEATHEAAVRHCFIDYEREMAIVAEVTGQDGRELIGVARLVADADHRAADYAVLVADTWQGRGLGSTMTGLSLEIAGQWGLHQVRAVTAADNHRMLTVFRHHGFEIREQPQDDSVLASRALRESAAQSR